MLYCVSIHIEGQAKREECTLTSGDKRAASKGAINESEEYLVTFHTTSRDGDPPLFPAQKRTAMSDQDQALSDE
jgi:hypothetical protein